MAKREYTEEEKKAWAEKMKAAREAKKLAQEAQLQDAPSTESETVSATSGTASVSAESADTDEGVTDVVKPEDNDRTAKLEAQVELLTQMLMAQQGNQGQANQNAPQTTKTPYSLDLSIYDSPVDKLMEWARQDARMRRQGFADNYEMKFVREIPARFPLADGSYMQVPKFTLGLLEYAYDDEGRPVIQKNARGEDVQIKYLRKRLVMFEDPDNALLVAHRKGLKLDDTTSQQFLNDMRYLQAQEWLLEVFYPPKPTSNSGMREEAIGGQMVTIVEDPVLLNQVESKLKA